jgi:hypothetical protein
MGANQHIMPPSELSRMLNRLGRDRIFHQAPSESSDLIPVDIHTQVMLRCEEAVACRQLCNSTRQVDIATATRGIGKEQVSLAAFRDFSEKTLYKNAMSVLGRILPDDPHARVIFGSLEVYTKGSPSAGVHYPYGRPDRSRLSEFVRL